MIGDALLVKQILIPKHNEVEIYLPLGEYETDENVTVWYEFWGGQEHIVTTKANSSRDGKNIVIYPTNNDWIMYLLAGNIIAIHDVSIVCVV